MPLSGVHGLLQVTVVQAGRSGEPEEGGQRHERESQRSAIIPKEIRTRFLLKEDIIR